jgi:hypothetical protein
MVEGIDMAIPFVNESKSLEMAPRRQAIHAIKMRGDDTFSVVFETVSRLSVTTLVTPACH